MNEQVTSPVEEVTKSPLEQLVETKGNEKFRDPDFLAKSKLEADDHISKLTARLNELESKVGNHTQMEEVMKALDAKTKELAEAAKQSVPVVPAEEHTPEFDPSQVEALINQRLEARTVEERKSINRAKANSKLAETFGADAPTVMVRKAEELGLPVDHLVNLAEQSPDALMQLLGEAPTKSTNQLATSEASTTAPDFAKSTKRNHAFYNKLRKEMGPNYWKANIQNQLIADRIEQGDDFYKE
jgi:hypothetical protein